MREDFEGEAGSPPSEMWKPEIATGFGNQQLEHTTDRPENLSLDGQGHLVITARKESHRGQEYTSARITTEGQFMPHYGRIEARIKLPRGQGLWPAFWMLGADYRKDGVGWPDCGEIDIMEFRGQNPHEFRGSLHGPNYAGGQNIGVDYEVDEDLTADFHVYGVQWTETGILFTFDGKPYFSRLAEDMNDRQPWVFDGPFFLILNLAVGGTYVGDVGSDVEWPQQMLVDYVHVYELVNP